MTGKKGKPMSFEMRTHLFDWLQKESSRTHRPMSSIVEDMICRIPKEVPKPVVEKKMALFRFVRPVETYLRKTAKRTGKSLVRVLEEAIESQAVKA